MRTLLRVLVPLIGVGVLLIAIASCAALPAGSGKVELLETRVDDIASTLQTVSAATAAVPGVGTIMGGAAVVATGIAGILHALFPKKGSGEPLTGKSGPG
jgi:hypothetical protein